MPWRAREASSVSKTPSSVRPSLARTRRSNLALWMTLVIVELASTGAELKVWCELTRSTKFYVPPPNPGAVKQAEIEVGSGVGL